MGNGWLPINPSTGATTVTVISDVQTTQNFSFRQPEPEISVWLGGEEILTGTVDLGRIEDVRRNWPFLRDRRIDAYAGIDRRFLDPE